jgi:hypothetical protein
MSEFDLPKNVTEQIDQNLEQRGAITLPFDVVYLWVHNGDSKLEKLGGADYHGGWSGKKAECDSYCESRGLKIPAGFTETSKRVTGNVKLELYCSRFVLVAPVGFRESWAIDRSRFAEYTPGARHHVQMLVYLYEKQQPDPKQPSTYTPWGPVVLSAKGFQANNLIKSLSTWASALDPVRRKICPETPPHFFLRAVGTFGKEPSFAEVGSGSKKSTITPIEVFIPEKVDEVSLSAWFVGADMALVMADLAGQAKTWLAAWNTGSVAGTTADLSGQAANYDNPPEEPDMPF